MYLACHSRILVFLLLLVSYIGLQKNLSTVCYEMTTCFFYIVSVVFSVLVLSWLKIKLLLKTKHYRKQINDSVGILPVLLTFSTGKKIFSDVWVVCTFSHEQSDTYSYKS